MFFASPPRWWPAVPTGFSRGTTAVNNDGRTASFTHCCRARARARRLYFAQIFILFFSPTLRGRRRRITRRFARDAFQLGHGAQNVREVRWPFVTEGRVSRPAGVIAAAGRSGNRHARVSRLRSALRARASAFRPPPSHRSVGSAPPPLPILSGGHSVAGTPQPPSSSFTADGRRDAIIIIICPERDRFHRWCVCVCVLYA